MLKKVLDTSNNPRSWTDAHITVSSFIPISCTWPLTTDALADGRFVQVVDAIKDLVQDCNFDCNDSGIALQAMDNSHVALVSMLLSASAFQPFRCDRNIALGINLNSLTKVRSPRFPAVFYSRIHYTSACVSFSCPGRSRAMRAPRPSSRTRSSASKANHGGRCSGARKTRTSSP